jgi:peptidoglycan/LPS O-acetylase OafA/YrhL
LASAAWLAAVAWACFTWLDRDVLALRGNGTLLRFHAGVFVTGMVAAFVYSDGRIAAWAARPAAQRMLGPASVVLLAFLFVSAPAIQAHVPGLSSLLAPMGWFYPWLYAVASSALLCTCLWTPTGWVHRALLSPLLRLAGIASYSLYLFHFQVIAWLANAGVAGDTGWPALFAMTLVVTLAIATVVYSWVERPFLVLPRSRSRSVDIAFRAG